MNTHVLDPDTDAELRSLDAASDVSRDQSRHDATLATILSTPSTQRRSIRRWVALGAAAAAAVTGAAIVLPTLTASPSYASWTARPDVASAADVALVREACVDQQGGSVGNGQASTSDLGVQLAERRGDFVSLLLSKRSVDRLSTSVFCLAKLPAGTDDVSDVESGATGGGGFLAPTGREFTQGAVFQFGGDHGASTTEGEVGSDVVGLTLHADGHDVVATIKDGTYAAWWPGKAFADSVGGSGEDTLGPAITYDVTYADGTVARDVAPTVPGGSGEIHTESAPAS